MICFLLFKTLHWISWLLQYSSIKPLGDRVLVKIKSSEEKTSGGILLPTTAQSKPQGGEIVAVGEGKTIGKKEINISVEVSLLLDNLLFPFHSRPLYVSIPVSFGKSRNVHLSNKNILFLMLY